MPKNYNIVIDRRKIKEDELKDTHVSADEMKKIIKDTMSRIKDTMDTRKFSRWMKERGITKDLRRMIVRVCNDENDAYLKNNPTVGGYASSNSIAPINKKGLIKGYNVHGDKSITLREKKNEQKGYNMYTAVHEFLHVISYSGKMRFDTFMNEGLTQYITELIKGEIEQDNGYRYNVAIVERLHNILGDKLIKAYFTGNPIEIEHNIIGLLGSKEKTIEFFNDLNESDDNRNIKFLMEKKKENPEIKLSKYGQEYAKYDDYTPEQVENELKQIDERKQRVVSTLHTLAIAKMREKFQNYEFYKDGQLDLTLIKKSINNLINSEYKMLVDIGMEATFNDTSANNICQEVNTMIAKYTHVRYGKTPDEIGKIYKLGFQFTEQHRVINSLKRNN